MKEIDEILDKIESFSNPVSIFLYGSRARNDYLDSSDYEIGVLYEKDKIIDEKTLNLKLACDDKYRIYPYEINEFLLGQLDIPFESSIFLRMVALKGLTLRGQKIIESFSPPAITLVSLLRDIKFQLGRASDSIILSRLGESAMSTKLFYKSCLWGTRNLIILLNNKFPVSYVDINEAASLIDLGEFKKIVDSAYKARIGGEVVFEDLISNVWYLNRFVEKQLLQHYQSFGDKNLIL